MGMPLLLAIFYDSPSRSAISNRPTTHTCYIACMQYEALLHDLAGALERGDVPPAAVERLLRHARRAGRRPDLAGVLRALGVLVAVAGAAALLATDYASLPPAVRLVVPYAFPAAAIAATLLLHRRGRPAWE